MNQSSTLFADILFPQKLSSGSTFLIESKTNVLTSRSGLESRIKTCEYPRCKYQINLNKFNNALLSDIFAFFRVVNGKYNSFRFKDHLDNSAINQTLLQVDSTAKVFQLQKKYVISGIFSTRNITKPVNDQNFCIYENNALLAKTQYSVDFSSGIVTFIMQKNVQAIRASFNFDTHVRFDTDSISIEKTESGSFSQLGDITLIEVLD